jgi:hypothetical protein
MCNCVEWIFSWEVNSCSYTQEIYFFRATRNLKFTILRVLIPSYLIEVFWRFEGTYRLRAKGRNWNQATKQKEASVTSHKIVLIIFTAKGISNPTTQRLIIVFTRAHHLSHEHRWHTSAIQYILQRVEPFLGNALETNNETTSVTRQRPRDKQIY